MICIADLESAVSKNKTCWSWMSPTPHTSKSFFNLAHLLWGPASTVSPTFAAGGTQLFADLSSTCHHRAESRGPWLPFLSWGRAGEGFVCFQLSLLECLDCHLLGWSHLQTLDFLFFPWDFRLSQLVLVSGVPEIIYLLGLARAPHLSSLGYIHHTI